MGAVRTLRRDCFEQPRSGDGPGSRCVSCPCVLRAQRRMHRSHRAEDRGRFARVRRFATSPPARGRPPENPRARRQSGLRPPNRGDCLAGSTLRQRKGWESGGRIHARSWRPRTPHDAGRRYLRWPVAARSQRLRAMSSAQVAASSSSIAWATSCGSFTMPCQGSRGCLRSLSSKDSRTTAEKLIPRRRASTRASSDSSSGKEIVARIQFTMYAGMNRC